MIKRLEARFAKLFSKAPHLPSSGRTWLAYNLWWLILILLIIFGIGLFFTLLFGILFTTLVAGIGVIFGGPIGALIGGIAGIAILLLGTFLLIALVLAGAAVSDLKQLRQRGWYLLFLLANIGIVFTCLGFLFTFEPISFIWNLLMIGVGLYLLFEVRSYFGVARHDRRKSGVIDV